MSVEEKQSAKNARSYDVVVIGGGAAGLSGALMLGRARRSVLVVDAGRPRNAPAAASHNYLTRDGVSPGELLAEGRAEVQRYGGEVVADEVVAAEAVGEGLFRVTLGSGASVEARRLLLASGMVDELPDVPGLAERWGRDVLHCPYCHGYEVRDQAIGVLSTGPVAMRQALLWRQWSEDVRLFLHTGPEPSDEEYEQLTARGIAVVDGEVTGLEVAGRAEGGDDRISGSSWPVGRWCPAGPSSSRRGSTYGPRWSRAWGWRWRRWSWGTGLCWGATWRPGPVARRACPACGRRATLPTRWPRSAPQRPWAYERLGRSTSIWSRRRPGGRCGSGGRLDGAAGLPGCRASAPYDGARPQHHPAPPGEALND